MNSVFFIVLEAFVPVAWGIVVWEILLLIGAILALIVMLTTSVRKPPKFYVVSASCTKYVVNHLIFLIMQINFQRDLGILTNFLGAIFFLKK